MDSDYELDETKNFILINYANKNKIINLLTSKNIISSLLLVELNKTYNNVKYIKYDNNIIEVDYYDLYEKVLPYINNYNNLSYNEKRELSNLIHYSNILHN
jgi:hypothetical protein